MAFLFCFVRDWSEKADMIGIKEKKVVISLKKLSIRTLVILAISLIASLATATAVAAGPFPTMP
ncbi:hypothetical protein [Dehalogenimonas etheniformans]|uniref:Uncharacterized protein n=1 Tax=Dehalogenimonas etheniformans TaxID=1536648 RepID=A0A2P5P8Q4_9CHLR|nr:hypothetical protein [Dehalogenimonas etheniformans]PPD58678.1 hypothetical protein JP09_002035 [Dehalogenimonas etheniformans]QNT76552.1 hypothetical protein HX448_07590 [Dehalogenimonas etheniformans]